MTVLKNVIYGAKASRGLLSSDFEVCNPHATVVRNATRLGYSPVLLWGVIKVLSRMRYSSYCAIFRTQNPQRQTRSRKTVVHLAEAFSCRGEEQRVVKRERCCQETRCEESRRARRRSNLLGDPAGASGGDGSDIWTNLSKVRVQRPKIISPCPYQQACRGDRSAELAKEGIGRSKTVRGQCRILYLLLPALSRKYCVKSNLAVRKSWTCFSRRVG